MLKPPHEKARRERPLIYPQRFPVPDDKVDWAVDFPEYNPPYFVAPNVLENDYTQKENGWADPEIILLVKRPLLSYEGEVKFDSRGRPLNPCGRTGIEGRGLLGGWGANLAADPIVTRVNPQTQEIEVLMVLRKDKGRGWALPGGMVGIHEEVVNTLERELDEETGIKLDMTDAVEVYLGSVDDPRNTDNAWIETAARHKHLDWETARVLEPQAGDDACIAEWVPIAEDNLNNDFTYYDFYASHADLIKLVIRRLNTPNQ